MNKYTPYGCSQIQLYDLLVSQQTKGSLEGILNRILQKGNQ